MSATQASQRERGDAARNRALLLDAARSLVAERGPDAVTMDEVATAAGVGKGTLFRRFGSRAGLMIVLIDEDEHAEHSDLMFRTPPLTPMIAYGRERLRFVSVQLELLAEAGRDPQVRCNSPATLHRTHVRML